MKLMRFVPAITAALVLAACGPSDPTAPAIDSLDAQLSLSEGAVVDPDNPLDADENENLVVCLKVVPESGNAADQAGERLIVKDDSDFHCPDGFVLGPEAG